MLSHTFTDNEVLHAEAIILLMKDVFTIQGIELEAQFEKTLRLENGMNRFVWDDGKDFTDENARKEFNTLLCSARNSKVVNPRMLS